jgi:hypothetical protein
MFALAVAVGVAVTIVIQITLLPAPPAVVAPIETPPDAGSTTYTKSLVISYDSNAVYPTLAGLGKLQISVNTTGWYYLQNDWVVTVVRKSTGDATFLLSSGSLIYVREIDDTRAFIYNNERNIGVVAQKVQVGTTGWIVYHPIVTNYDSATARVMTDFIVLRYGPIYVFQPKPDYVTYDPNTKTFYVCFDSVTTDFVYPDMVVVNPGAVCYANTTSFTPIPTDSPVTVSGIERIDTNNYVLYSVWALLDFKPNSSVNSALTISPAG